MPTLQEPDYRPDSVKELENGLDPNYVKAGTDQLEAYANDSKNSSDVSQSEASNIAYENNDRDSVKNNDSDFDRSRAQRALKIAKEKGGLFGLIGIVGGIGALLAGFFGPASMLINLMENFTYSNDSSSVVMERRFLKAFVYASNGDPICQSTTKTMKCRMGRISNKALRKLEKKGVKANFDKDTKNAGKLLGYPSKNPKSYTFDLGDGSKPKTVQVKDLRGFLAQKENRKMAAKVLGYRGAFNMRLKAWTGKYLAKKFYGKFKINRTGGIADGEEKTSKKTTFKELYDKVLDKVPGISGISSDIGKDIKGKLDGKLKHAGKGGPVYLSAYAACLIPRVPRYITAGVAAIQLARILPIINEVVLSPGSKAKASAVGSGFNSYDMEKAGTLLTEKTPREGDKKLTSALDSVYLLAALGVNKGKPPVSENYTPGYSFLNSSVAKKSASVADKTDETCSAVMSPQAMYAAFVADSAATVAASATLIGGIFKIAASFVISKIVEKVVSKIAEVGVQAALNKLAGSDKIPLARGEAFGDVLGVSAAAFFSAGAMSRGLPTLKQGQLTAYEKIHQESEQFNREMDIASLSPFDTTSRYTFLGSIVHSLQTSATTSGAYANGLTGMLSTIFSSTSFITSSTAMAGTNYTDTYCGYAKEFGFRASSDDQLPAVNLAGLPCTGMTPKSATVNTDAAINYMTNEGWLDEGKLENMGDDITLIDMMEQEVIKEDTPLRDYINECTNPDTGEYIVNADTCSLDSAVLSKGSGGAGAQNCYSTGTDADGNATQTCWSENTAGSTKADGVNDPNSIPAIVSFLVDFQIIQSVNGEDDEEYSSGSATTAATEFTVGTYNLLDEAAWGGNCKGDPCGNQRTQMQVDYILGKSSAPAFDLIGMQEVDRAQWVYMQENLPSHTFFPSTQDPSYNGIGIVWNSSKFSKVGSGEVDGYTNTGKKTKLPWVTLQTASGKKIHIINTHSPNSGNGGNEASSIAGLTKREFNAKSIHDWAKSMGTSDLLIATGDFNDSNKKHGTYCMVTDGGYLQHAKDMMDGKNPATKCPSTSGIPLDQIYLSPASGVTVKGWTFTGGDRAECGPGKENSSKGCMDYKEATDHSPAYVTISMGGSAVASGVGFTGGSNPRIATYNVLGASHTDDGPGEDKPNEEEWGTRIAKVKNNIQSQNIDIIGFQEFEPKQKNWLSANLNGYRYTTLGKNSDAIGWNANKYTKIDEGTWDSKYFNMKTIQEPWVKLKDKSTEQEFYVMNVHDPIDRGTEPGTCYENAKKHLAKAAELSSKSPVIITGDFNNGYRNEDGGCDKPLDKDHKKTAYCVLSTGGMTDGIDAIRKQRYSCEGDPRPDKGSSIDSNIDHIFISGGLSMTKYFDINKSQSGSDHVAVVADVVIPRGSAAAFNINQTRMVAWNYE